ncbi:MAG: nucleoside-diphosphate kinase [Candidatus Aenigmatarchaeota archaeon]
MKNKKIVFGLLKPDCVIRQLVDKVFNDITSNGFSIEAKKQLRLNEFDVFLLYGHNSDKPFYSDLVAYMTCADSIAFLAKCNKEKDAIDELNKLIGYYIPHLALQGTLRKKYAIPDYLPYQAIQTIIHSPNTPEENRREIKHFFPELYEEYIRKNYI